LIPVSVEQFDQFAPPADLRQINWFDLVSWSGEDDHEGWRRTLTSLGKLVGRDLAQPLSYDTVSEKSAGGMSPTITGSIETHTDVLSDLRTTWDAFPAKSDARAVQRFLDRVRTVAAGSGIEFEVEYFLDELKSDAERRAQDSERSEVARRARDAAAAEMRREEEAERMRPGKVWYDAIPGLPKSASPEMITLPPGAFLMGSANPEERVHENEANEEPQHEVRIDYPFALGNYVVTFTEWDAAIAVGAKIERPVDQGWGRDRMPVINVSWRDAKAYISWLNARLGLENRADAYRLPSEAEWEYASRAGTKTAYCFGSSISSTQANHCAEVNDDDGNIGRHRQKAVPVGSFPPNAFGLHDMHGNVWEWCEDVWNINYSEPKRPDDGMPWLVGDTSRRVLRGGSWDAGALSLRSASRRSFNPTQGGRNIGFRLARTISPQND